MTWKKCRDVIAGEEAVKLARDTYLPRSGGMEDDEYDELIGRAEFFNATGRTLDGLHGMLFRINPTIGEKNEEKKYKDYFENVDGKGRDLKQFISDSVKDILTTGWGGILVEAPQNGDKISQGEAEKNNVYPYLAYYRAEDIPNWRTETRGRVEVIILVVLQECEFVVSEDGFDVVRHDKKRVLDLDAERNNFYRQRVYIDGKLDSVTYPTMFGKPMKFIPFYFSSTHPEEPMLLDLINVNLAWYRKSADYERGLHYTSVPTPYTTGFTPTGEVKIDKDGAQHIEAVQPIKLSPNKFIHFPNGCTGAGMLEYSGAGMNSVKTAMEDDEERMAILGARIISAEKKGVEAADTAKIHRQGENSVLAAFANNQSKVTTQYDNVYLQWCMSAHDINVPIGINTDFDISGMAPAELTAFVAAWQAGGISKRVLFYNLKQGEKTPPDYSFDQMQADLENEAPKDTDINMNNKKPQEADA
jgi:hypothetical protein